MLAVVGVASVLSGIAPASRAVWLTEMFWAWGLVAILLVTFRKFRFSGVAYACFFVTLGAACSALLFLLLNRNSWSATGPA